MPNTNPIRVLIVDDHAMLRSGLRTFLLAFDDLAYAGEAGNGPDAIRLVGQLKPDVVLMDLIMPGMDGILTTREIKARYPDVKVIALTSSSDPTLVADAIQAGAISYLLKSVSATELANAIRAGFIGSSTFSPEVAQALLQATSRAPALAVDLTERERQVLGLMVDGKSNAQIAGELVVSLSTVKFHVSSILSKLGVKSRAEAISLALQNHLVERK
jgi:NarL family two-component system response regulator LiaR